jgi:C2 domain
MFDDKLFGTFHASIVQVMSTPFFAFNESLSISLAAKGASDAKLLVDFIYEEGRTGMFAVTLFQASGLSNVDPLGNQRPYVNLSLGKKQLKRSKTIENGPTDPYFGEEELFLWSDKENWKQDLLIEVLDEDIGATKPIATVSLSMLPYMNYATPLKDGEIETISLGSSSEITLKVGPAGSQS